MAAVATAPVVELPAVGEEAEAEAEAEVTVVGPWDWDEWAVGAAALLPVGESTSVSEPERDKVDRARSPRPTVPVCEAV